MLEDKGIGVCIGNMFLNALFVNQTTLGNMWYIPMILYIYLLIPIIVYVMKHISGKMLAIPLIVIFVARMVLWSVNNYLWLIDAGTKVQFVFESATCYYSGFLIYIFAGYWIGKGKLQKIPLWVVCTTIFVSLVLCTGYQFWVYSTPKNYLVTYYDIGIAICTVFLFELIRRCEKIFVWMRKPIVYIAKISFGIYFVHIVIMSVLFWYFPYKEWDHCVQMIFLEITSFAGSVFIIWILSKVPILKKYMFMIKD